MCSRCPEMLQTVGDHTYLCFSRTNKETNTSAHRITYCQLLQRFRPPTIFCRPRTSPALAKGITSDIKRTATSGSLACVKLFTYRVHTQTRLPVKSKTQRLSLVLFQVYTRHPHRKKSKHSPSDDDTNVRATTNHIHIRRVKPIQLCFPNTTADVSFNPRVLSFTPYLGYS